MSNRDALKAAIALLVEANNGDGLDHEAVIESVIDNAVQSEIENGLDVSQFPPQTFIDLFTSAARRELTEEVPCEVEFYLPIVIYGLHKSNVLLGSQCYFYGEFVSLYLPNLEIGIFVDDEARFYEVTDAIVTVQDKAGNMAEPEHYSENPAN